MNLGPKGTDCLGIFNYLWSQRLAALLLQATAPDGSRERTGDEKQKPGRVPALALAGLEIAPLGAQKAECARWVGLSVPAGRSAEMITVQLQFPKQ